MRLTDFPPLMVVTDRRATRGRALPDVVKRALDGGVRIVQLREKDLEGRDLLQLARELRALTAAVDARLLVNDRIDVAIAAGADGVVLPASSFSTADARRLLGPGRLIARSTHSPEEAMTAAEEGCELALFGPVWETPSKTRFGPPQGLGCLREAAAAPLPVIAIGGITAANAAAAIGAGATAVAAIRAVMAADDPAKAAASILEACAAR